MTAIDGLPIRALAIEAVKRLAERRATIAVAESCTGGWLGASLSGVPGASSVFWGGVIAYDDRAKLKLLGVSQDTLIQHGAVSEDVAVEMASGVVRLSGVSIGIGITGVAGPDGGTDRHPVGAVYIALAGWCERCRSLRLEGDRDSIRRQSVAAALTMITEALSPDD